MKIYFDNILLNIEIKDNILSISAISKDLTLFNNSIKTEQVKNNFIIKKIKNYEILKLLSSNFKENKESEFINIKFFQIIYNLKKIIKNTYKDNPTLINLINISFIEEKIKKIQYIYKDIKEEIYINDKKYEKEIYELIEKINNLIDLLIQSNKYVNNLKSYIFLIKNFKNFTILNENFKITSKNNLKKQKIFLTYQKEEYENILPYNNIYTLEKSKKILTYNFDDKRNIYVISYSYNLSKEEKQLIKKNKNDKFYNLNKIFKTNINFNINNTKFRQLKNIHINRIYVEKMLFELNETDLPDSDFEEETVLEEIEEIEEEKEKEKEIKQEEILKQINEEKESILLHQEEFDKDIEEKLFF